PSRCGKREYYATCGSKCAPTCYTLYVTQPCIYHDCEAGCYCKRIYLRSSRYGRCVIPEKCPYYGGLQ
ncbi:hypothetical protein ILUMI_04962, partial [Ignelater luminosus]